MSRHQDNEGGLEKEIDNISAPAGSEGDLRQREPWVAFGHACELGLADLDLEMDP